MDEILDQRKTTDAVPKSNGFVISKNLPAGENRYRKVRMVLFDIFPNIEEN